MNSITSQILQDVESLPLSLQEETLDFVRFLKLKTQNKQPHPVIESNEPSGAKLARVMTEIAERGTAFRDLKDPAAWQRELRRDRTLPGREE